MACYLKGTSCTCGEGGGEKKTDAAFKANLASMRVTYSQPWSLRLFLTHRVWQTGKAGSNVPVLHFVLGGLGPYAHQSVGEVLQERSRC